MSNGPLSEEICRRPLRLRPDNFTPLTRTPWAGREITRSFKDELLPEAIGEPVGESWEFSCDPDFPSRLADLDLTLPQLVESFPAAVLGEQGAWVSSPTCELLVKLLNAADPLSLQIHPPDGDAALRPGECGKPESWYVLSADEGAGLYLGFARPLPLDELRAALHSGDAAAKELLNFVPVRCGDYFEIEPGVPHAIGPGVTLLEPQRIRFGESGKTYRLWDWGRRYDSEGRSSAEGKPRELHLEAGLRLLDSERQVGVDFVDSLRRTASVLLPGPGCAVERFPANPHYQLSIVRMQAGASLPVTWQRGYGVLIVLGGAAELADAMGTRTVMRKGETYLLPAILARLSARATADCWLAHIAPATAAVAFG